MAVSKTGRNHINIHGDIAECKAPTKAECRANPPDGMTQVHGTASEVEMAIAKQWGNRITALKKARRKNVTRDTLSDEMDFDHVVVVNPDGTLSEFPSGVSAPESVWDNETGLQMDDDRWEAVSGGYTGQYGYNGPVMHPSEQLSGRLAQDILDRPGMYVTVVVMQDTEFLEDDYAAEPVGWAVLRLKDDH